MSLKWDIFMIDIVKVLGFPTENALKYICKEIDHQKL